MILISSKVITFQAGKRHVNNNAVFIQRDKIVSVGPAESLIDKYRGHYNYIHRLDDAILMPGLVNLHTHIELPKSLYKIRTKTFADWVLNLVAAKKKLTQTDFNNAVSAGIKYSVKTGTTTIGEICTHDVSSSLLEQSGLHAVIFYEIISMDQSSNPFPAFSVAATPLIHVGISPHTPYTVSEKTLRLINGYTKKHHLLLAMHVAESKDEIRLLQRKKSGLEKLYQLAHWDLDWAPHGTSSFEYLDRIGSLSPNLLAVHAVQVTDEDLDLIKKHRVSVAHCPRSNRELGVGRMPLKKMLDAGITVGLGTDSLASVPTLSMWDEMRYAYRIHRQDGVSAEDIFKLATIGGARALGLEREIGTIEPGKKADLIAVAVPEKNTGNLYSDLLRETKSCIMSMVNGKILYQK